MTLDLQDLARRGIELSVTSAGKIHYRAPGGALTPELMAELAAHKPELVKLLSTHRCWICADLSTGEVNGRHYCSRHLPVTPTTRALVEAVELYQRLSAEWDALIDSGQRAPDHLKCESSQAAVTVADLCQQTREADR